ncbi:MAG: nitroreductase family protein [Candidatus Diapherotrites archaeon]|nr:nitroreductase family protein [Candidatus Diapherotrites archaeon]
MEFFECVQKRRAVRKYKNEAVPEEKLDKVMEAIRLAPTARNLQPFTVFVVKDAEKKEKLAAACRGKKWVADAGIVLVAVARPEESNPGMGSLGPSFQIDTAIAMEHAALAATAVGLGSCWIGAFDEEPVKAALSLKESERVVALMPVGIPAETPEEHKKKPAKQLFKLV